MATSVPQLALITGASKGIGRSTALAFAKAGVSCVLVGRSVERLQSTLEAVRACGVEAFAFGIDLAELDELPHRFAQILNQVGPIDVLVNNAGMAYTNDLLDTPPQDWQAVIDLNLTSPFLCTQAVLPQMRSRKQGTIINVISVAGRQTFPQWGAYCASKFGLMGFSKTLAQEERSYGIRVISLCPGSVNTPLWDNPKVQADFARNLMLTPEDVAQAIVNAAMLPQHVVIDELVLMPNTGTF